MTSFGGLWAYCAVLGLLLLVWVGWWFVLFVGIGWGYKCTLFVLVVVRCVVFVLG